MSFAPHQFRTALCTGSSLMAVELVTLTSGCEKEYFRMVYTVDWEIFVVKIFVAVPTRTKNKNAKYFLHGESLCTSRLYHTINLRATVLILKLQVF